MSRNVIFRSIGGSHLYGLATPNSDLDYKEIIIPKKKDLYLGRAKDIIKESTSEKNEKNSSEDIDVEIMTVHAFLKLVSNGHFNAIDTLFSTPTKFALLKTDVWNEIWENRERFLTSRANAMIGYCQQQAMIYSKKGEKIVILKEILDDIKSYIEKNNISGKRRLSDIEEKVMQIVKKYEREEVGVIEIRLNSGEYLKHLDIFDAKSSFTASIDTAIGVYENRLSKYGDRAKKAASTNKVDWKAVSHAVRIGIQSEEYLLTGNVTFPLRECSRILDIKNGFVPYEKVEEEIVDLLERVRIASEKSTLKKEVDQDFLDDFVYEIYSKNLDDINFDEGVEGISFR